MKKMVFGKKFSRDSTSRRAMYRALVRSFVINRKLTTTYTKAKVIGSMIENLIQKAKRNSLVDRRAIYRFTGNDREITDKIIELAGKISASGGGYLRSISLPARKGDNAPMVRMELSQKIEEKMVKKDGGKEVIKSREKVSETVKEKPSPVSVIKKLSLRKKVSQSVKK
jgi:large subunit ribosomal protein L17